MTELDRLAVRDWPPHVTDGERSMLNAWLEFHRATLAGKCVGLTSDQLRTRSVPPSRLSLLGLLRHMTDVERYWFQSVFAGAEATPHYWTDANPDADFDDVDAADVDTDVARFDDECRTSRLIAEGAASLDVVGVNQRDAHDVSLRWILVHMIEEYARHNGHADLIRERIDGAVGD
jgi:uncharacterized damage-inducible protein DinB